MDSSWSKTSAVIRSGMAASSNEPDHTAQGSLRIDRSVRAVSFWTMLSLLLPFFRFFHLFLCIQPSVL